MLPIEWGVIKQVPSADYYLNILRLQYKITVIVG